MRMKLAIGMTILAATAASGAFAQSIARTAPRARAAAATTNASYLGIGVQDIDSDRAKTLNLKEVRGAEVTSVANESPAAKAGMKDGDVVLEFNGQPVEGGEQLSRLVRETPIGRQVKLGIWRNGAMQTVTATVEARKGVVISGDNWTMMPEIRIPSVPSTPMPGMPPAIDLPGFMSTWQSGMLGIMGESMSQQEQLAEFFGVKEGVLVKSVNKNSAAEKAGIKAGDVIVRIEDQHVGSTREITTALRALRAKKNINVTIVRNKKEMTLPVTLEAATPGAAVRAMISPGRVLTLEPMHIDSMHIAPMVIHLPLAHRVI